MSVFGRLKPVWKNKHISLALKVRRYESLVLSTMLYCVELWPLSVTQQKQLKAADHTFQCKLELISKERRLRLFGHVLWMDDGRLLKQVIHLHWEENTTK